MTYLCSIENGAFQSTVASVGQAAQPCATPLTYNVPTTNNGQHQFAVEAVDTAGNVSQGAFYSWKVAAGTPAQFVIHGSVTNIYIGVPKAVPLTIDNPNSVPIFVSQLTVTLTTGSGSGGCAASNFSVSPWSAATTAQEFQVPAKRLWVRCPGRQAADDHPRRSAFHQPGRVQKQVLHAQLHRDSALVMRRLNLFLGSLLWHEIRPSRFTEPMGSAAELSTFIEERCRILARRRRLIRLQSQPLSSSSVPRRACSPGGAQAAQEPRVRA